MEKMRSQRFKVLADENRLRILEALMDSPSCVKDLVAKIQIDQSLLSHHLRVLRDAQLVETQRRGQKIFYNIPKELRTDVDEKKLNLGCCNIELSP